ncbi:bifunctional glycosyltransferase/CDP-glycerol:glycerophosphate glycerophosphotransferase [Actinomadura hibisca]|uniref:bifunctional glycosyltransferase/CDP-glycerol:glycerophosphate glycerophosphotransferase n=1 Tax=Actinomadura hibisca TaxID=68565 RepID=UPI00082D4AF7|nr:bifunctional glycosyltransferase family 2 protein/CDP-glycerol:glycerophosphate glycerophosphotransferase [Actinomadura hibisca]
MISIVVPFHNVERYLAECLESLAAQTHRDLEVIMVDDGSPDGSAVVAKTFAHRDERFRLVQQDNQGLGPARNAGAALATGDYLAFVDSDDVVPPNAYELLAGSLERTGSDIACGAVRRLNSLGLHPSPMHRKIFTAPEERTHVSRRPDLLGDRTAWNKLYRRAFWTEHGFLFPPGLYEDAPVTVPAHVLAGSVDLLRETVYHWREREGDCRSITQRRTEAGNMEDRIGSVTRVAGFFRGRDPELRRRYLTSALGSDLALFVNVADEADAAYRERLRVAVTAFLEHVDDALLAEIDALKRLKYHLIRHGRMDDLLEVLLFQRRRMPFGQAVRKGALRPRWYARYPFYGRDVPDAVYDVTDELALWGRVDRTRWRDGTLVLEGHAYIGRLDMSSPGAAQIKVWLRDARTGTVVRLPVRRTHRPDVTAAARYATAGYDWSGFEVEVPAAALRTDKRWRTATWELHAEVRTRGLRRAGQLGFPAHGAHRWPEASRPADGVWIRPVPLPDDRFGVQVKTPQVEVTGAEVVSGELVLTGSAACPAGRPVELLFSDDNDRTVARFPARTKQAEGTGVLFTARLPLTAPPFANAPDLLEAEARWSVLLEAEGQGKPFRMMVSDVPELRHRMDGGLLVVGRSTRGNLRVEVRPDGLVLTGAAWEDGQLVLSAEGPDGGAAEATAEDAVENVAEDAAERAAEDTVVGTVVGTAESATEGAAESAAPVLVLRLRQSGDRREIPGRRTPDGLRFEFDPAALPVLGEDVPLTAGAWLAEDVAGTPVRAAREVVAAFPKPREAGLLRFTPELSQQGAFRLAVAAALADDERGRYPQALLQRDDYPRYRSAPLRELAVFDSFKGRQFSDSPRAIYEELRRRRPDIECLWVSHDGRCRPPEGVEAVLYDSRAHYRALAQARYLVSNDPQPEWLVKRPGQFYLQTWHGTPLKRIGFDIATPRFNGARDYLRRFGEDVAKWDALLSPNPFSTPVLQRAFRYEGEVLETGYPRNDLLATLPQDRARRVRERLGVPAGKRVVLYAPTWRDDQRASHGYLMDLRIDLDAARRALGDDHVLLVRGHFNVGETVAGADGAFVIDVTAYPDIAELLLISDILVTDYSSVLFDFAMTLRPMLFFTYDLERYRDDVRGFCFDFEKDAPGPLLRTSAELIDAVRDADTIRESHARAYQEFSARFCPHRGGDAARRAVDRLLAG